MFSCWCVADGNCIPLFQGNKTWEGSDNIIALYYEGLGRFHCLLLKYLCDNWFIMALGWGGCTQQLQMSSV